jgi:hypothetical protein
MMLKAIPQGWFSWNFSVMDGAQSVVDIQVSWWRERGRLTVQDQPYTVYRDGFLGVRGAFILESAGVIVARAEKPSAWRRCFRIEYAGRQYTLRATSAFRRAFHLLDGTNVIGSLTPEGSFTYRTTVDLPDALPLPVQVFMIWLTVLLWQRDEDASAAAAAGAS